MDATGDYVRNRKFERLQFANGGPGSGPHKVGDRDGGEMTADEKTAHVAIKNLQNQNGGFARIADVGEKMDMSPRDTHNLIDAIKRKSAGRVFTSKMDDPQSETKYDKMYSHPVTGNNLVRSEL